MLALLALQPAPFAGGDNATYLALARSILERGEYTEIWDPAERPSTLYPPLFPLFLAGALALGASSWISLKVVMAFVSAGAVGVSTLWLARVAPRTVAASCALLLAALPGVIGQTHMVLSEIPFWALAMVALWAFAHYEADDARPRRWLILAAVAIALAWLTRSAGIALAAALVARLLLLRRRREALLLGGIATAPVALWWLRGQLLAQHGYSRYLMLEDPYRPDLGRIGVLELIPRAFENAGAYFLEHGPRFVAGTPELGRTLALAVLAVAIVRWAWRIAHRRGALELWVLCYGGLVLIWPQSWAGERFLVPLAPAILFYAADAVGAIAKSRARAGALVASVAMIFALVTILPGTEAKVRLGLECRAWPESEQAFPCTTPVWRELFEVAVLARGQLPPGSVVISRKPTLFWELSGYRSAIYPWSDDPNAFFRMADSVGAEYVVLDKSPETARLYLVPVLEAHPSVFCVIQDMSRNNAIMLRIDVDGARALVQDGAPGQVRFRICESVS